MAAKKTTKKAENNLDTIIKNTLVSTKIEWNGININIKNMISIGEMMNFERTAVETCFVTEDEFIPSVASFQFNSCVLRFYTDLPYPEDLDDALYLIYGTDIMEVVYQYVNIDQIKCLEDACTKKFEYKCDAYTITSKLRVNNLINSFDSLASTIGTMSDKVESSNFKKVLDSISEGVIDEKKLVDAFIENKEENKSDE